MSCTGGNNNAGTPRRTRLDRVRRRLPFYDVEIPHDLLDPLTFVRQSPERRDILSESPVPSNLPHALLPPPLSRAERQLMIPMIFADEEDYDIDDAQLEDANISFGEADIAAAAEAAAAAAAEQECMDRNWEELQAREAPGGGILNESFLLDVSRTSTGSPGEAAGGVAVESPGEAAGGVAAASNSCDEPQNLSNLSDRSMEGFVIGLRERVRDPAERFRRLQAMRERRLPIMSTPERQFNFAAELPCQQIENEREIEFYESPPPTPPPSPRTQAAIEAAERRFQEINEDPRMYYENNPCPTDTRRRPNFPPLNINETAENLDDLSFGLPPSPTRGVLIEDPYMNPRLEEEIRTGARARIQALIANPAGAGPRPRMEELARLEPRDDVEVVVTPEQEERMRAAARIRAHFVCYPAPDIPADAGNIEQDCSIELNDDSIPRPPPPPRGPHERYSFSTPREPCDTRGNRSLPRSQVFGIVDPIHMREDLLNESFQFPDRSLTESERGYVNQTLPPRPQLYPCDRRRSAGATPPRPQRRRQSMPRMDYEEPPEPIPPELLGAVGPLVLPEFECDNAANYSMIDDQMFEYNNVLDVEDECTQDSVQVQAPNRSPWRIQIRLMAPTGEPQPGPSGIRPPSGRAGASGIRPPGRSPQPRQGGPSSVAGPSGVRRPASSGLRAPSTSGLRPPSSAPCPPAPCPPPPPPPCPPAPCPQASGLRAPSQSGLRAPSQSGLRAPSQVLSRGASQTSMRPPSRPSQSNICPPSQTGMRPPGARRSPSQARPAPRPQGGAIPRNTGAIPRNTGAIPRTRPCPPSGQQQSAGQAASQTRLQRPASQSRMRPPTRRC